jgi:CRP-like cAMP-binding protein
MNPPAPIEALPETAAVVEILRASTVFNVLSERARERLAAAGSAVSLQPGEFLCQVGDEADAAYVVLSGELEIRTAALDGRELRFTAFAAGALVGEMAVLDGGGRSADMAAARRTRVWRIPRESLLRALEEEPRAALAVIAELSRRLRLLNEAMEQASRLDLGGRLAVLLLGAANRNGVVVMTQTEMARRLGFSREKVNRKLRQWSDQGWIRLGSGGVSVQDASALEALARAG